MPPGFQPPRVGWLQEQAFWVPLVPTPQQRSWGRFLLVLGRLRPAVTAAQAATEMAAVSARLAREEPDDRGWTATVVPLAEQMTGDVRTALVVLLGTVALLAAMAVTNVAMLTLARMRRHRHELAMRRALGASRARLMRQLLTQSMLLGAAGAVAGVGVALAGVRLLVRLLPPDLPRAADIRVDAPVLLFGLAAAVAATLVFGCVGALGGSAGGTATHIASSMRERTTARRRRSAGPLVVTEVALGLVLAALAALMTRSFVALRHVDLGFRAEHVVTARVALSGERYASPARQRAFYAELLGRVRALPGVRAAGLTNTRPLGGLGPATTVSDAARPRSPDAPVADVRFVDREYFAALRIPVVGGVPFDARERPDGVPRVVVNEALTRTLWPGARAVGRRVRLAMFDGIEAEVVGVVGDVRLMDPHASPRPTAYLSAERFPDGTRDLVVRVDGAPATALASLRATLAALDPTLPLYAARTLDELVDDAVARDRFTTLLLGAFATLALLLAAVGIFGVLSSDVADRRAELGIRFALGARRSAVLLDVVRRAVARAALGVALGTAAALVLARSMTALLFGVGAADAVSFVTVGALLLAVAAAAALLPALHAARVSPVTAMRHGPD
jgi:putative ABC transport system permease protein